MSAKTKRAEFDRQVAESGITRGHRVSLDFGGGILHFELICPEDGSCKPATQCGHCAADLTDPESKRCYDCQDIRPGECWLQSWFDDAPDELMHGKIEFPVTAEWDCDHPIIHIEEPASDPA